MVGVVEVNDQARREILRGSLHVYAQNVVSVEADNGDWVEVKYRNETLGYGFYSEKSSIPVKVYSFEEENPEEVISRKMEKLWREKRRLYSESFRWVFGEGDLLPGLIVDVFFDVVVIRTNVYGLDKMKDVIVDVIAQRGIENVVERNEGKVREKEGLPRVKGMLLGSKYVTEISEGSARFVVDALNGQKTGFYLDQRENRIFSEKFSDSERVLDVYSYTGGFGIHLGINGAEVHFVDLGKEVIRILKENIKLNGINGKVHRGDAVEVMKGLLSEGESYDVVSLDPPALIKHGSDKEAAKRTYFLINRLAIRLLRPGGILLTSSCSQPLTPKEFLGIVRGAAEKEGKRIRLLGGIRGQSPDHTYYPPHPETHYLKHIVTVVE